MADINIKILTPATSFAFITLAEIKTLYHITTVTTDEQLQMMIDLNSSVVHRLCNRIFARERVREIWRDLGSRRVFLSHWPVKEADIESVQSGDTTLLPGDWELEEESGKVSNFTGWVEPITIVYTGGYLLPDEAPLPLKQATSMLVRESKIASAIETIAGIRSISHKEKRVQFFDPTKLLSSGQAGKGSPTRQAVDAILSRYIHYEV